MTYLLDANVFIEAKNRHYGIDFCPAFWTWIYREHVAQKVFSIGEVAEELHAGNDDLAKWARGGIKPMFTQLDDAAVERLSEVVKWVQSQPHQTSAKQEFLAGADSRIVAYALAHKYTIVTHEVPAKSFKKIKIPDVCIAHSIECITPFELLRREKARFVLSNNSAS